MANSRLASRCGTCGSIYWCGRPCKNAPEPVTHAPPAVNSQSGAVNRPAVNRRGAYPNTDDRRTYMRDYMRKKRGRG